MNATGRTDVATIMPKSEREELAVNTLEPGSAEADVTAEPSAAEENEDMRDGGDAPASDGEYYLYHVARLVSESLWVVLAFPLRAAQLQAPWLEGDAARSLAEDAPTRWRWPTHLRVPSWTRGNWAEREQDDESAKRTFSLRHWFEEQTLSAWAAMQASRVSRDFAARAAATRNLMRLFSRHNAWPSLAQLAVARLAWPASEAPSRNGEKDTTCDRGGGDTCEERVAWPKNSAPGDVPSGGRAVRPRAAVSEPATVAHHTSWPWDRLSTVNLPWPGLGRWAADRAQGPDSSRGDDVEMESMTTDGLSAATPTPVSEAHSEEHFTQLTPDSSSARPPINTSAPIATSASLPPVWRWGMAFRMIDVNDEPPFDATAPLLISATPTSSRARENAQSAHGADAAATSTSPASGDSVRGSLDDAVADRDAGALGDDVSSSSVPTRSLYSWATSWQSSSSSSSSSSQRRPQTGAARSVPLPSHRGAPDEVANMGGSSYNDLLGLDDSVEGRAAAAAVAVAAIHSKRGHGGADAKTIERNTLLFVHCTAPTSAAAPENAAEKRPATALSRSVGRGDGCAVCLDAFFDAEMVRMLPCVHCFHRDCVDRWLTRCKACPICKRDIDDPREATGAPGCDGAVHTTFLLYPDEDPTELIESESTWRDLFRSASAHPEERSMLQCLLQRMSTSLRARSREPWHDTRSEPPT
ncbi:hypothetical protein CDCA_CDCA07G2119 [Cyanidium caldarium]|uniref:RING-type E3 ubiquitin transferase n=1 Tax=Cyanidium caldarium TaxID=2771 RepID=A0AAV9IUZ7_CYACA|nr:hypothetical protein CDCA_CDCA07G2119 [Cyanidium caldarium]